MRTDWQTETGDPARAWRPGPAADYSLDAYAPDVRDATTAGGAFEPVIGHSLGGSVSTVIAAHDPGWTRRLVLFDPVWYVPADELPVVSADQASDLLFTPESLRAAKPHWEERDIAAKLAAIAEVDPAAVRRTFGDPDRWDLRDVARASRCPRSCSAATRPSTRCSSPLTATR